MSNIISDIVDDATFKKLFDSRLLDAISLRNYAIRKQYRRLREKNMPSPSCLELIQQEYPYLNFDSLKRIVYGRSK